MTTWLWMRRLLLLACVTSPCISIQFFPDSEFDGRPVTREDADAFFKKLDEKINLRNKVLSAKPVGNATGTTDFQDLENSQRRDTLTSTEDDESSAPGIYRRSIPTSKQGMEACFQSDSTKQGYEKIKDTSNCRNIKINEFLAFYNEYDTLEIMSDGLLNGEDYLMRYYKKGTTSGRNKTPGPIREVIAVNGKGAGQEFTLTGVLMYGDRPDASLRVPTLTIDLHPPNPKGTTDNPPLQANEKRGPEYVDITLSGRGLPHIQGKKVGTQQMAVPITLTKAYKKKVWDINYDTQSGFQELFKDIKKEIGFFGTLGTFLNEFGIPQVKEYYDKVENIINKVEEETQNYTLMASFNKEKAYQIQLSRGAVPIDGDNSLSQLSIILSFENENTKLTEAGFAFFGMASQGALDLFKLIGLAGDNFITRTLSTMSSEDWCLYIGTKDVEYIGGRKTEVINTCLGVPVKKAASSSPNPPRKASLKQALKRSVDPEEDKQGEGDDDSLKRRGSFGGNHGQNSYPKQRWGSSNAGPAASPGMDSAEEEPPKGLDDNFVAAGAHYYMMVEFKAFLDKCWEDVTNQQIRTNFHIKPKKTQVPMYATLTKEGVTATVRNGGQDLNDIMKNCIGGALIGAPNWLTGGVVNVDNFQYKTTDKSLTISISVTPKENEQGEKEPLTLPGTQISLEKLDFTIDRKPRSPGSNQWTTDISGETTIDIAGAPATVTLNKVNDKYTITADIESLKLSDLFNAFTAEGSTAPEILQTIGVEDFKLNFEFGSSSSQVASSANSGPSDFKLDVSGKPVILGFDQLTLASIASRTSGVLKFSVGVHLASADFTSVMKNLGAPDAPSLKWLKGLEAIFIYSHGQTGTVTNQLQKKSTVTAVEKGSVVPSTDGAGERHKRSTKGHKSKHSLLKKRGGGTIEKRATKKKPAGVQFVFTQAKVFDSMKFVDGLTFGISWTIPATDTTCEDNGICKWLVKNLGDNKKPKVMMITGSVTKTAFRLKASLTGLDAILFDKTTSKMTFKEVALVLEVGTKLPKFMVLAKIAFYNEAVGATGANELMFTGSIEATPVSIAMTFSMDGFIFLPRAYIAIGDLSVGIGFSFTSGLPTMVFGATIMFGDLTKDGQGTAIERNPHAITVEGRFGINPGYPQRNFFYGRINKLTVNAICEAFKIGCTSVPPQIKETGFPNGITLSFAGEDITDVPGVGTISGGIYVKGTLNLLGYEVHAEIGKKPEEGWMIDVKMSPLNIANGWIKIQKDANTPDEGPYLHAQFGGSKNELEMSAYANALDIYVMSIKFCLSSTKTYFMVEGPLIPGLVDAKVEFFMNYGGGSENLFELSAEVKVDKFMEKIKDAIKAIITGLKALGDAAIAAATALKERAEAKLKLAVEEVNRWKAGIENWKQELKTQKQELQKQAQTVPPCTPACELVCVPFLDWNPSCWKIWGVSVGCPYWNSCFTKVKDLFCLAKCALERVVSTLTRWAKQAILEISMLVAEGAKGLLKLADGVMKFARDVVKGIEDTLTWMKEQLDKLEKLGHAKVDDLFKKVKLEELKLTASVTSDFKPCLAYSFKFLYALNGGSNDPIVRQGKVCLDWKSFLAAFVKLVTGNTNGELDVSEEKEKIQEAERKNAAGENSMSELSSEESKAKNQIDEEEKKKFERSGGSRKRSEIPHAINEIRPLLAKLPKRETPLTEEEKEIRDLVRQPMPRYYIQDDPDVEIRSLIEKEPWSVIKEGRPVGFNSTVHADPTVKEKRQLDFDESLSPCDRMKRALKGYDDLTDGLMTYSKAIEDSSSGMEAAHNARAEQLKVLRSKINAAEKEHNMTMEDGDEAYMLYDKLNNGHKELTRKSSIAIEREDSYALPIIRRQLNGFLKKANGKNFVEFTELMHVNAVKGYKRSGIPHPSDVEGEKMLSNIKKDLQSIVTDESSSLRPMTSRLDSVKKNIVAMSTYTKQCRQQ